MKKLVGIISACLMLCTAAFAEGYFSAEDMEKGTITEDVAVEDGFVLHATSEKYMNIAKKPMHKASNGEEFSMALQLQGSGKSEYRSVSFPAKAGETITVWGNSTSKSDMRPIVVAGPDGKVIKELPMDIDGEAGTPASDGSVKAPVDGTYTIYSKKSGINIYKINVGK
ncbi:MAG: PPC domain-containing protein [Spirochaetia bacterium]|nr:PPC domain-containing protein [Spirochaetia bacterium]